MTAKRNSKKRRASKVSDPDNLFRSLASAITSVQISKQPILKHLLQILDRLSLTQPVNSENPDIASHYWKIKLSGEQVELINLDDVCNLSLVLFAELDSSFESLFSVLLEQSAEACPTFASIEESIDLSTLFLRCCMKIMSLSLAANQQLVLEQAQALLSVLRRLIRAANGDGSFELTREGHLDLRHTFLWKGLEVFMDEILVNKSIRDLLCVVDSASPSCRLFSSHDMAGVVEMVSAHLIISTSDEKFNKLFVERLCWEQANVFRTPLIPLCSVLSLLPNLMISAVPRMIHAYVVLLVSDCIGICSPPCVQLIDRYIDAFEKSVILYTWNMSKCENAPTGKLGSSTSNSRVAFKHLLLPLTLEKVNHLTVNLKESWCAYQSNNAKRENNELVAYSVAYAKASLCVFDSSCSENMLSQTLSILGCVILRASSDDVMDSVLQKYSESSMEDLCLLASTLKLMCCSMLRAIRVLRNWNCHQSEAKEDVRASNEYKAMMDVVQRFERFSVHLPGQSFLHDRIESRPNRHVKSKWMLMHFSGLLSVSYALKLDFLMKNSVFGMVVSMYMFILEEGDLEALGGSVSPSESPSSSVPTKKLEASGKAEEIALKFQKFRTLYLGKMSKAKDRENGLDSGVGLEEESCNGERFLWCLDNMSSNDAEDLADFIVCEPDKDYADWLKGRERFRKHKMKSGKIALQRWHKKQKAWRESKGRVFRSCAQSKNYKR